MVFQANPEPSGFPGRPASPQGARSLYPPCPGDGQPRGAVTTGLEGTAENPPVACAGEDGSEQARKSRYNRSDGVCQSMSRHQRGQSAGMRRRGRAAQQRDSAGEWGSGREEGHVAVS